MIAQSATIDLGVNDLGRQSPTINGTNSGPKPKDIASAPVSLNVESASGNAQKSVFGQDPKVLSIQSKLDGATSKKRSDLRRLLWMKSK